MTVAIPKEHHPGETRVALTPVVAEKLAKLKLEVAVESGAGTAAGFSDAEYQKHGARLATDRAALLSSAELILQVRVSADGADLQHLKGGQIVIGHADPLTPGPALPALAKTGATVLAVELIPRISRAQAMDALSSQSNLAGYSAVILAARHLPRIFPMLMTAAGTLKPAKVFVIGAGVAGLQAIATARRLGGVVHAFDVRPAVKEQVQSLGAKFVELPLETKDAEDKGGYAKEQNAEQLRKQQELMGNVVAASDVVITTALIPGQKAPLLVTADMVRRMGPGSVLVDLAAEQGGNCELTVPGEIVQRAGVTLIGLTNLPATVPYHASEMYANNLLKLVQLLVNKEGALVLDTADEIIAGALVCRGGEIVNPRVRKAQGIN
ncbi:MAG: Re/Si-specific NAD(P)(+) transhydrogenase subunit alpha [Planctomycetota bacterium]